MGEALLFGMWPCLVCCGLKGPRAGNWDLGGALGRLVCIGLGARAPARLQIRAIDPGKGTLLWSPPRLGPDFPGESVAREMGAGGVPGRTMNWTWPGP